MSHPVTPSVQVVEDDDGPEEGEIEDDEDDIILVDSSPQPSSTTSTNVDVYPSPSRKESYERDIRNFELRRSRTARLRRASGGSKSPYINSPSLHGNDSFTRTKTKHSRTGLTHGKENRHVRHKSPIHHRKESHDRALADFKDHTPTRDSSCSSIDSAERNSERNSHQRATKKHKHERVKRRTSSSPESSYIPAKRRSRQSHHSTKCPLIKVLHSVAKETRLIAMESSENHPESSSLRQRLFNMGAMPALRSEAQPTSTNDENNKSSLDVESRSNSVNSSKEEDSDKQLLSESTQTDEVIEDVTSVIKPDPEVVTLTDSEDGGSSKLLKTPTKISSLACDPAAVTVNPLTTSDNLLCNNSDDNDDDISRLRLLALQSKKQDQHEPNPLDDGDVLQLRLAALKTAFMKKFKTRKKLPVNARKSKEDSIFPLDEIPLPFSPASPASPDEVITPVDMELAETDDEEVSLHSMSHYSPSDPIPDCYSPSDDPYPDCYSPSDPTGSPTLERSIQELLPPPPPPDFDLYFPDPTYETPLQGISIDNSYPGCYMDHIPSTEMLAPPPVPSFFRELLSDSLYQSTMLDQSSGTTTHITPENVHCLVPENISMSVQPINQIVKQDDKILVTEVGQKALSVPQIVDEQSTFKSINKYSKESKLEIIPVLKDKEEEINNDLHCEKQFIISDDLNTVGNAQETSLAAPFNSRENEEISLEEEEKLLRQRLLLNLANKRAKLTANQDNTVHAPTSNKNVLPDVVPSRSNLIVIHPMEKINTSKLNPNCENSTPTSERREEPLIKSSKQKSTPVKTSRPKSHPIAESMKVKSAPVVESSKLKLMEPFKPKSTHLVVPSKQKSNNVADALKRKSSNVVELPKTKSSQLEPLKPKPQQVAVSSQTSEEKRFIIHLGEDSDSNEEYSEAEALGQKCAKNKEKWILYLKELEVNPTIKGLPLSGSKRNNLITKQAATERNPKPFAENLADLENSVVRFLKGVRSSHEARVGNTSSTSTSTPVAVKHLPVSQQEEYRRLKQQIAQLERQREISTRRLKQTAPVISKSTQVASRRNISTETNINPNRLTTSKPNVTLASTTGKSNLLQNNVSVKAKTLMQPMTNTSSLTHKQPITVPTSASKTKLDNVKNLTLKDSAVLVDCSDTSVTNDNVNTDVSSSQFNIAIAGELPQNKDGLLRLQSTVVTERSHVLKELSSLAKLLAQVDQSLEAQSHTATEVSSLIDKLCLAAGRWKAQNRTVASLVQKVAQRQKVISARNRSCVAASKTCAELGNQLYGNSYRIPLDKADLMRLQLKQVHEKTQELAKRRTTEQAKKRTLESRAESCLIKLFSDTQNSAPASPSKNFKEGKLNIVPQPISTCKSKNETSIPQEPILALNSRGPAPSNETSNTTSSHINSEIILRAVSYRMALNKVKSAKTVLNCARRKRLLGRRQNVPNKRLGLITTLVCQDSKFKDDLSDMDISTDGEEPGKKAKDESGNTDVVDMSVSPDTSLSPPNTERESYLLNETDTNVNIAVSCDVTKHTTGTVNDKKQLNPKFIAKNLSQCQVASSTKSTSKSVLKNYVSPLGGLSVFSNNRSESTKGDDLYAILCPYDLNGKCQDLGCLYKHQHRREDN